MPRKRVRGSAGGHFCQRAKPFSLIWGKTSILSYFSLCPIFSYVCVRSSLLIFSQISFFIQFYYDHDVIRSDTKGVLTTLYLVGQATESRINTWFSLSHPDLAGVSQGCQSTIPIRKKSLQKQRKDLASVTIKSHITRSLFLLLYLLSKTIAGAPKKGEVISRGT